MTRKLSEIISDMRNIVKPYIAKQLKQLNFENCGSTDKAEFETEFEVVLTLAEMANNQWIPCSERMPKGAEGGTSDWHTDRVMVSAYGNLAYDGWEQYKHEILTGEFWRCSESNRLFFEHDTLTLFVPYDMDFIPLDEKFTYHADKDECTFYSNEDSSETEYHDKFIQIQAWRPLPEPFEPQESEDKENE